MFNDTDTLTIAVPKGRVLEEIIPIFDSMKLSFFDDPFKSRKLIFKTSNPKIRIILLRPQDVATYVKSGVADLGISGLDVLEEMNTSNLFHLVDLNIIHLFTWQNQTNRQQNFHRQQHYTSATQCLNHFVLKRKISIWAFHFKRALC